jgi:death-on-curing protein
LLAIATPAAGLGEEYVNTSLYEMAAPYAYHLVVNHPFVDGNKRTGAVAAIIFLDLKGVDLTCTDSQLEEPILAVARSKRDKGAVSAYFRCNARQSARGITPPT